MREIYVDGACKGNPGPGGFGVVELDGDIIRYSYQKSCEETTNNREELKAIIHALEIADEYYGFETVLIYSDSAYCVNMINDWIWTWARNNWKNSKKKEVENIDLVKIIYNYINKDFYHCQVVKTSGHCGIAGNELADALATFDNKKYNNIIKKYNLTDNIIIELENL